MQNHIDKISLSPVTHQRVTKKGDRKNCTDGWHTILL